MLELTSISTGEIFAYEIDRVSQALTRALVPRYIGIHLSATMKERIQREAAEFLANAIKHIPIQNGKTPSLVIS